MLRDVNYLAVLVSGIVIFMLGGLWYSSLLFARRWIALMGRTEEEMRAAAKEGNMALSYMAVFICGLLTAVVLAHVISAFGASSAPAGAMVGALCWAGFAATTSFGTSLFSFQPRELWMVNTAYNLVSFVVAGAILGAWR
jgi:hypothetical protein